jgi:hypothetical protein
VEGENIEQHWLKVRDVFTGTSAEVLGYKNPLRKDWMSEGIWKKI